MLLSKSCNYAIRASLYLAINGHDGKFVSINKISKELDISFHFLTKILQTLTRKQLLTSFRGPNGGIALARPAREITLMEIIEAIDGEAPFDTCILGLPECSDDQPCPLHDQWRWLREKIKSDFSKAELDALANSTKRLGLRLNQ